MVLSHRCRLALVLLGILGLARAERTHITVLSTTDLHGHVHPFDYFTGEPVNRGLAKAATLIKRARQLDPELILLDSGDTIQGSPFAYHAAVVEPINPNPIMAAMNALRYDAMAPGNHEFNFGLEALNTARRSSRFAWISANICLEGSDDPAYAPYIIKQVRGVRVGVLGLTTPTIPAWEDPAHYDGLYFMDPVAAAKRWVSELRRRSRVDVVIIAMHMGLEEDILSGTPTPGQLEGENAAVRIAREVPGVDLILMGHTHREVPSLTINGVLLSQAGFWGDFVSRTTLMLERAEPTSRWQVIGKTATTHPITEDVPADPQILEITADAYSAAEAWMGQPIGNLPGALSAAQARFKDTAIMDLIHRVQLEAGDADVSLAACFNPDSRLPEGELTVRDIAGLYVYENTLVVVELTGAELKEALEHAATYFGTSQPGAPLQAWVNPAVPGYNFDMAEGVEYVIDLSRPAGDRITDLYFRNRPLKPDQKLRVATNNYRQSGGGGYAMIKEAPVLSRSNVGIRDLIIAWVQENPDLPMQPTDNWSINKP
ncbi:MAG: bifunctional metallophosphatase/5'-nucleotidase [Synoicihabitans sp.]